MDQLEGIWASALSPDDGEAYDRFVSDAADGHYSQTRAWARVIAAGGIFAPSYFLARRSGKVIGTAIMLRPQILRGCLLPWAHTERGPICDNPIHLNEVLTSLLCLARQRGVFRLSVMPNYWDDAKSAAELTLRDLGFVDVQSFRGRHARSLRLDLSHLPNDEPFSGGALRQVRQNIRRAERAGATARQGKNSDLEPFRRIHEQLLRLEKKKIPSMSWYEALNEYFLDREERGAMFVCEHEGAVVSAIFVARHGALATYVIGASSGEDLHFPKMVMPMARAINWARQNGATTFDFGGIPMEGDPDAKRASISEFKHSFSRIRIDFVHEHARWF